MRTAPSYAAKRTGALAALALAVAGPAPAQPPAAQAERLAIDLPTALALADDRNLDIAIHLERIEAATARVAQARMLAVPALRVGADYDRHTGNLQETSGQVVDVDRASRFSGIGAGLGIDVADAVFAPLVARQSQAAVAAASAANRHLVLVEVATAYLRLLQAREEMQIVEDALERAVDLATLTGDYAEAGEGLLADAEMTAVQPLLWEQRRLFVVERTRVAAAELARLLHLDPNVELDPLESAIPMLQIFSDDDDVETLVARALLDRPETDQLDALVAAAENDLNAERYGLFIPNVGLDYSLGAFGGGPGSSIQNSGSRDDLSVSLYWQFDGFGFGHRARTDEKRSQLRQLGLERERLRDDIAAEVRQEYARVQSFAGQLNFAQTAVTRASQAYLLNRERIFDQQGLPLEALQAMQTLATTELAELEVRTGHGLAQIRLQMLLGRPVDPANR